jgi:hypothetical protein
MVVIETKGSNTAVVLLLDKQAESAGMDVMLPCFRKRFDENKNMADRLALQRPVASGELSPTERGAQRIPERKPICRL